MNRCIDIGERIQSTPISWQLLFFIQQEHCDLSSILSFHIHSFNSIHRSNHLLVQRDLFQINDEESNNEDSKVRKGILHLILKNKAQIGWFRCVWYKTIFIITFPVEIIQIPLLNLMLLISNPFSLFFESFCLFCLSYQLRIIIYTIHTQLLVVNKEL